MPSFCGSIILVVVKIPSSFRLLLTAAWISNETKKKSSGRRKGRQEKRDSKSGDETLPDDDTSPSGAKRREREKPNPTKMHGNDDHEIRFSLCWSDGLRLHLLIH